MGVVAGIRLAKFHASEPSRLDPAEVPASQAPAILYFFFLSFFVGRDCQVRFAPLRSHCRSVAASPFTDRRSGVIEAFVCVFMHSRCSQLSFCSMKHGLN